jgi:hypothetical protein
MERGSISLEMQKMRIRFPVLILGRLYAADLLTVPAAIVVPILNPYRALVGAVAFGNYASEPAIKRLCVILDIQHHHC